MKNILIFLLLIILGGFFCFAHAEKSIKNKKYKKKNKISQNQYIVKNNKRYGVIDITTGEFLLPVEYNLLTKSGHCLILKKENKLGLYDIDTANVILNTDYSSIKPANPVHFLVTKDDKTNIFYFNKRGISHISNEQYKAIKDITSKHGYLIIAQDLNGKKGILNQNLVIVAPFKFDDIVSIDENVIKFDEKFDFKSELSFNFMPRFDKIERKYKNGFFEYRAYKDGSITYYDENGHIKGNLSLVETYPETDELLDMLNKAMNVKK